jgi:cytochrome c-type biogenesis protein CcmH
MRQASRARALALMALMALMALTVSGVAYAVDNLPPLSDPVLQQRYLGLTHELRCMQCQDEALADSPVSLAADLRREVRDLLLAGKSDAQIRDHMVARYGDFILYRPRMNLRNAWLWGAPFLLMAVGVIIAGRVLSSRRKLLADDDSEPDSLDS